MFNFNETGYIPAQLIELMMTYKYILKTSNCFSDGSFYTYRKLD